MEITKEYELEQDDCVKRNLKGYEKNIKDPVTQKRLYTLKDFCIGAATIISVGSGAFEPVFLNATHAVDIPLCTFFLLKDKGWKGEFFQASCDHLPFASQLFDVAVCSEVIEHLPDLETVRKTFQELSRIAKRWIVTTPIRDCGEPTHKFIFTEAQLAELSQGLKATIETSDFYFYIHNDKRAILS